MNNEEAFRYLVIVNGQISELYKDLDIAKEAAQSKRYNMIQTNLCGSILLAEFITRYEV